MIPILSEDIKALPTSSKYPQPKEVDLILCHLKNLSRLAWKLSSYGLYTRKCETQAPWNPTPTQKKGQFALQYVSITVHKKDAFSHRSTLVSAYSYNDTQTDF
ncbi:hypothetical protein BaRGS_00019508 [Batillaria attramentaria]|uniref:Uncharacterized protein n=1 Tax=Batillaria attramentaria TaxID=370345 RepID=A0ABD0KQB1_9CAEN